MDNDGTFVFHRIQFLGVSRWTIVQFWCFTLSPWNIAISWALASWCQRFWWIFLPFVLGSATKPLMISTESNCSSCWTASISLVASVAKTTSTGSGWLGSPPWIVDPPFTFHLCFCSQHLRFNFWYLDSFFITLVPSPIEKFTFKPEWSTQSTKVFISTVAWVVLSTIVAQGNIPSIQRQWPSTDDQHSCALLGTVPSFTNGRKPAPWQSQPSARHPMRALSWTVVLSLPSSITSTANGVSLTSPHTSGW